MIEVFGGKAITPLGIKKDISIAVKDDIIFDIGKTSVLRSKYSFMDSIGGNDLTISPSFVDSHTHSFQYGCRNMKGELLEWLKQVWAKEATITKEMARSYAEISYLEMIKSGVSTFVDYTASTFVSEAFEAAKRLGLRAFIGKTLMDKNAPHSESTEKCIEETKLLITKYHRKEGGLLNYSITPRFALTCSDELLIECKGLSEQHGCLFTIHSHESQKEIEEDRRMYGKSAIEHFDSLGLLGKKTLLVHCVHLTPKELTLLAKTETRVAHCPGSNLALASGIAKTKKFFEYGIEFGIGSDVGAYPNFNIFDQMRLAVLIQQDRSLTERIFDCATSGNILGINSGKLQKGYLADIALLSNCHDKYSAVFNSDVNSLICNGKILMRNKKIKGEQKIREKLHKFL